MHRARLPVLHPCDQDWSAMPGTTRRHCAACDRDVVDLSALSAADALATLREHRGSMCVRYTTDAAGELLSAEPPAPRPAALAVAALALGSIAWTVQQPAASPDDPQVRATEVPTPSDPDPRAHTGPLAIPDPTPAEPDSKYAIPQFGDRTMGIVIYDEFPWYEAPGSLFEDDPDHWQYTDWPTIVEQLRANRDARRQRRAARRR